MITYRLAIATVLLAGLAAPRATHAQDEPPADSELVGTWDLSVADSEFGRTAAPDSAVMTIERADDRLVMRRDLHFQRLGGVRFVTFDMPTDGGTYEAETSDGTQNVRVSWEGSELVMVTEAQANVGPVEVIDRLTTADDGQQLVIDRLVDVPGMGTMESTLVFVRQE